jgi:hypothetical protein
LLKRMQVFKAFPETDFLVLMSAFLAGQVHLKHFFDITLTDSGLAAKPKGADGNLPLARFRVAFCLSPVAFDLAS